MWCLWSCSVKCLVCLKPLERSSKSKADRQESVKRNFRGIKKFESIKTGKRKVAEGFGIKKERSRIRRTADGGEA